MPRGIAYWSLITVGLLLVGPPAFAQPTTTQPVPWSQAARFRMDCGQDLHRFCYGVQPGEGRLIQCLFSHRTHLSPGCISHVAAARPTLGAFPPSQNAQSPGLPSANPSTGHAVTASSLRASCGPDAQKLCAGVSGEIGGIFKCLSSHRVELSPTCDAFFNEMLIRRAAQKGTPKATTPTVSGPTTTPAAANSATYIAAPSAAHSASDTGSPSAADGPAETGVPSSSNAPTDITDTTAPARANGPAEVAAPSAANPPASTPVAPNGAAETGALSPVGNPATMPAAANGAADSAPAVNGSATINAPPAGNATAATGANPAAKSRPAKDTLDFPL
jgi:hypothetical protein